MLLLARYACSAAKKKFTLEHAHIIMKTILMLAIKSLHFVAVIFRHTGNLQQCNVVLFVNTHLKLLCFNK